MAKKKAASKSGGQKGKSGAKKKKSVAKKSKSAAMVSFARATTGAAGTGLAAAEAKRVDFTCSNPGCVVGITAGGVDVVFVGTGGAMFPQGTHTMFYRVQGAGAYSLTVSGATLSAPIAATAPDAGVRMLTV